MRPSSDRAWIEQVIAHRDPGAVPYNFMFSPPAYRLAAERYGRDLEDALGLPIRMGAPAGRKPFYASPSIYGATITDDYGVVWSTSDLDRGSPIGPVLTEPTLDGYTFPDPAEPSRFAGLAEWCRAQAGHFRFIWTGDLWERATFMRGMEGLLLDVALHRDFVRALLERLTDAICRTTDILLATCAFEGVALSDDYGTQRAMVISPADWRDLVRPCLARIYSQAKRAGKTVFHHSCGNIVPIIPDLIDLGLDILHPIQPEAMDVYALKREFGRDLTLCGGVSTQDLLLTASPAQVRGEVRRLKETLGRGGGYILEPGITLLPDVPAANLFALLDEARAGAT